ncbi:type II secretion system protein J [Gimesia aquarii]|nr:hypothetical protein [Gimesia aquarii]
MQRFIVSSMKTHHGSTPGISLVEVVVAMGIATVLMGISMTIINTVMRTERETSKATWLGSSFYRFSRLIRSDIHAADSLDFLDGDARNSPELTIKKAGNEVVKYHVKGSRIFRFVIRKDQQVHQDTFYLPEGSQAYFFQRKRSNQAGISIDQARQFNIPVQKEVNKNEASTRELSIISIIGHDHRLASIRKKQPEEETK